MKIPMNFKRVTYRDAIKVVGDTIGIAFGTHTPIYLLR